MFLPFYMNPKYSTHPLHSNSECPEIIVNCHGIIWHLITGGDIEWYRGDVGPRPSALIYHFNWAKLSYHIPDWKFFKDWGVSSFSRFFPQMIPYFYRYLIIKFVKHLFKMRWGCTNTLFSILFRSNKAVTDVKKLA